MLIWILIAIGLVIFIIWFNKTFKIPKIGAVAMFDGAPKTGKSTLAIDTAIKTVRRNRIITWLHNKMPWNKNNQLEMPLLYSNIPIKVKYYVPLTKELITRKERFVYKPTIYMGEFSLVADSMEFRDQELNEQLQLFAKLIGHETRGGTLIIDTQCIGDCHYAIKRVIGQHFYIHSCRKMFILPFIILKVRELIYSDDGSTVNAITEDVEDKLKTIIITKSVWKKFDSYCYSVLTDDLKVVKDTVEVNDLKARKIISFKKWRTIKNENSD